MWQFILTDLHFLPLGEILNASERTVALPLNKLPTLIFKVRLDNTHADPLASNSGYIKGYRNGNLEYFGPIVSAEEVANNDSATVAVNSVGGGWILQKRYMGKSVAGFPFTVATDRAQIVKQCIDSLNREDPMNVGPPVVVKDDGSAPDEAYMGIGTTAFSQTSGSAITYTAGPFRDMLDIITELSTTTDGFDWEIVPVENFVDGAVTSSTIGQYRAAPLFGTEKPDAVFEYGTGRHNVSEYGRTVSRDTQANKVYNVVDQAANPASPIVSAIDLSTISDWGLIESLASADLVATSLRSEIVQEHVRTRALPRQIIRFTPHIDPGDTGRVPQFRTDFEVGDLVHARAAYNRSIRFDGMMRVWGITFQIDEAGLERTVLSLVDEG